MRGTVAAVIAVVAILLGAGAGYLIGNVNERTVTSVSTYTTTSVTTTTLISTDLLTTTATVTSTAHSTDTAPSLELFGSVSPPSVTSSKNVSLNLGVFNPLPTAVQVNVSAFNVPYPTQCGSTVSGRPDWWVLFSGHVTFSNLSTAEPLLLYNASQSILCFRPFNSTFTFQPDSDAVYTQCIVCQSNLLLTWDHTYNYSGYWVPSFNGNYKFQAFPPGQYTALFFDVWGQRLLEYFTVTP